MKNLIGYLKKTVSLSSLLLLFLLPISSIFAEESFQINTSFEHTVLNNEINTEVILQISSESAKVISYYTATLPEKNLETKCYYVKTGKKIDCTNYHRGSNTDVLFNLNNSVVKPDSPLEIKITYTTKTEEKNAYNISSKILDTTTNSVIIKYPKEKGEPLWTSDPLSSIKLVKDSYQIAINKPIYASISLLFGENILYKFNISRSFQNSTEDNQTFELVIPPDTKDQTIIWDEISPLPNSSTMDEDGNYIFKYILSPNKTLDCKISGYIEKVVSTENQIQRTFLTEEVGYWNIVDTSETKRVQSYMKKKGVVLPEGFDDVNSLDNVNKELFYKNLYKYVVEKLNFDKDITLGIEDLTRLGANTLTESSQNAMPIDYADYYIALLRKYGVPSRLVIGYVSKISGYTSDGFYHYWVEYFDSLNSKWLTADPFLEDYTEKDLFKSDFYDHVTVLRRGKSTVSPNITFYSESDFKLEFLSDNNIERKFEPKTELYFEELKSTDKYLKGYIYITNNGNLAITNTTISSSNINNIVKYIDPVNNVYSQIILPKQSATIQTNIPYNAISSSNIFVYLKFENNSLHNKEILIKQDISEVIPIYIVLLSKFASILIFFIFVYLVYFVYKKLRKKWIIQ